MSEKQYIPDFRNSSEVMVQKSPRLQLFFTQNLIEKYNLGPAVYAFGIVNSFFFTSYILLAFIGVTDLTGGFLIDLDFSLAFLIVFYLQVVNHPILILFIITGWLFSNIWIRRNYGKKSFSILMQATLLPFSSTFFVVLLILVIFFPILGMFSILIFFIFIFYLGFLWFIAAMMAFISYPLAKKITTNEISVIQKNDSRNYLILQTIPPTPNEVIEYCPFKMKDKNGCSFLGYQVEANKTLICDFSSTYRRCNIYFHLYGKVMENGRKSE
jgi:hypothetical protein